MDSNSEDPPDSSTSTTLGPYPSPDAGASNGNGKVPINGTNTGTHGLTYRRALLAGVIAMVVNFTIAFLKLAVNTFISPSATLFSEGLHSLGDGLNSIILLWGIVRGNQTPDRSHPFGYGLEANFWALFASFILFLSAGWAIYEGIHRFSVPPTSDHDYLWAMVILMVSMVFEVYAIWTASTAILEELSIPSNLFTAIPKAYLNVNKAKVPTTRYVFFEDTLAFLGAFIAFVALGSSEILYQQGFLSNEFRHYPDALGSIVIGVLLVVLAFNLFSHNKEILIGSAASDKDEGVIRRVVLNIHGVSQIHNLKTIDQGHAGLLVYMTVEVEPDTPVKDVDDLTLRIKEKLSEALKNVRADSVFIEVLADESEQEWDTRFELLITDGLKKSVLEPRDQVLLQKARDFGSLLLRDVMVPRPDVLSFERETPLSEVLEEMLEHGHTRWPVFGDDDELLGIIHARDVFRQALENKLDVSLESLIRDINIYPETKRVSELLEEFKREKLRMAAVLDEHGSFEGVVTLEDLMEELVGEIADEHEAIETSLEYVDAKTVVVSGKYNIEDLNDHLNINIPTDEFVTLGGFVFGQLGREPEAGDETIFEDLTLRVLEVDGPRIVTVHLTSAVDLVIEENVVPQPAVEQEV